MEISNWGEIRRKVSKEAEEAKKKLEEGSLISREEAAVIRENELYKDAEEGKIKDTARRGKTGESASGADGSGGRRESDEPGSEDREEADDTDGDDGEDGGSGDGSGPTPPAPPSGSGPENPPIPPVPPSPPGGSGPDTPPAPPTSPSPGPEQATIPAPEIRPDFDINNREQQIEMIREAKIYYAEKLGREGNLTKAFTDFEKDNQELLEGYRGKDILLKVNLVDPDYPQACTSPDTIKKIIEFVRKYGPRRIYVGDIPSRMGKRERSWAELRRIYEERLGYQFGPDVELIDMESLANEELEANGDRFMVKNLDRFGGVINIARPKMHGQFGFTGCTKNLMGFMVQESRENVVHMHGPETFSAAKSHLKLQNFSVAMLKNRPDIVSVLDGTDFVSGHEHLGSVELVNDKKPGEGLGFAMVSRDPINSDIETLEILGLNKVGVSYLWGNDFPRDYTKIPMELVDAGGEKSGDSGGGKKSKKKNYRNKLVTLKYVHPSKLVQKFLLYEAGELGGVSSIAVIDDPSFLEVREIKKRQVGVLLDILLSLTSLDVVRGLTDRKVSYKDVFEMIFKNDEEMKKKNPYSNMPEFQELAQEWLQERTAG